MDWSYMPRRMDDEEYKAANPVRWGKLLEDISLDLLHHRVEKRLSRTIFETVSIMVLDNCSVCEKKEGELKFGGKCTRCQEVSSAIEAIYGVRYFGMEKSVKPPLFQIGGSSASANPVTAPAPCRLIMTPVREGGRLRLQFRMARGGGDDGRGGGARGQHAT